MAEEEKSHFLFLTESVNNGVGPCQDSGQRVRSRRARFPLKTDFTGDKLRLNSLPQLPAATPDESRNNGNHCEPSICGC